MATVLFFLKKSKGKTARQFLYYRITVNHLYNDFSTEEVISRPDDWIQDRQLYLVYGEEGDFINTLIVKLKYDIKQACLRYGSSDLTPKKIQDIIKPPVQKPLSLQEALKDYIEWEKKERGLAEGTLRHRQNYLDNLAAFAKTSILAAEITLDWCDRFKSFLAAKPGRWKCKSKTRASRHIEYFKKALDHAIKNKRLTSHELTWYRYERDPKKSKIYLDRAEQIRWLTMPVPLSYLHLSQKIFSLQMLTGIDWMDIYSVFEVREEGGERILVGHRGKTGQIFYVPYLQITESILKEFNFRIPEINYDKYLQEIKLVAALLGITKHINTKVARKTFIMQHINGGWNLRLVQEMAGHASIKTTEEYYADPDPQHLINEMSYRKRMGRDYTLNPRAVAKA